MWVEPLVDEYEVRVKIPYGPDSGKGGLMCDLRLDALTGEGKGVTKVWPEEDED